MHDYPKTVKLKDGRSVALRPLVSGDFSKLRAFFEALPDEDRLFFRNDVRDPELIRKWTEELDFERVIPIVAEEDNKIVADGTLHMALHGWMRHVGFIRLVTARTHRHIGLGAVTARELVAIAEERGLEKLQVDVIEDDIGSAKMLQKLGFEKAAVLRDMVKDQQGNRHNLAIMITDVTDLGRVMEDWIQYSMVPGYRAPGEGN